MYPFPYRSDRGLYLAWQEIPYSALKIGHFVLLEEAHWHAVVSYKQLARPP